MPTSLHAGAMDACSTLFCTDTGQRACIAVMDVLYLLSKLINFSQLMNALHAILCTTFRPDLINMEIVSQQSNQENLEQAFEIAESLGVTRLLDAEGEAFNQTLLLDLLIF